MIDLPNDTHVVEVRPSALGETSRSRDDFNEAQHLVILSRTEVGDELRVEFTIRQGAENLVEELNYGLDTPLQTRETRVTKSTSE